jgi:nicotinate-nucleotide adenylyltransferase
MSGSATDLGALLPPLPENKRVALLGGSFNPPHLAHALLALCALSADDVGAVWVLPCADHPFGKSLAPLAHRVAMCRLAFAPLGERVQVVDVESRLPTPSFTVQTLRALRAARPAIEPKWIIGSDILPELHLWRESETLETLCELFVVPRAGYDDAGRGRLGFALPEISSTDVRARLAGGGDVSGLLDRGVAAYVAEHELYAG